MINLSHLLADLTARQKSDLIKVALTNFFVLFSYPMLRSVSGSYFLSLHGASELPKAWFLSVIFLVVAIGICNRLQKKFGVHQLFMGLSLLSCIFFSLYPYLKGQAQGAFAYALLVWKEIYIVLLMHLLLAYTNSLVTLRQMKLIYGPFGAIGSLGGISGGVLTSLLTPLFGTQGVLVFAALALLIPATVFYTTHSLGQNNNLKDSKQDDVSPLKAIEDVRSYVFYIALIVAMSQFCVNIADFRFNLLFEQVVTSEDRRTELLGQLYSSINIMTLVIQFVFLPFMLSKFKSQNLLLSVPIIFAVLTFFGLGLGGGLLWSVAISFASLKGVDYSLFATVKELLYHPMSYIQKFGAKYICDMFAYRTSKSVISFILIFLQNTIVLNFLMGAFLLIWAISIGRIFKLEQKLFEEKLS